MASQSMFSFKIQAKCKETWARAGVFKTPHGEFRTPAFIPAGTKANVKTLTPEDLEKLGCEIILANTYHLALRPGPALIAKMGGLHRWMNWSKPLLTDSGGFQVFSLSQHRKITAEGVYFKSPLDGSKHFFTPERVIEIQEKLGADIIMAFDECAPGTADKTYAKQALKRTHEWAKRCLKAKKRKDQALFPIIQGVIYDDLRIESAKFMTELNQPGIAVGGLSVGESKKDMYRILKTIHPYLPEEKPHYLMGIGTPEDLLESVAHGMDMFDCVLPTRLARHGAFWDQEGRKNIDNLKYKKDPAPLSKNCSCSTCQNFSKSYLRHLMMEKEILGLRLLTIHNLHFLLNLMREIRNQIKKGTFLKFKKEFRKRFKPMK